MQNKLENTEKEVLLLKNKIDNNECIMTVLQQQILKKLINNEHLMQQQMKFYYDKELIDTKQKTLEEDKLKEMINTLYINKSGDLKKYIRDTLKENMGDSYNSFASENIILEMFSDPEYSKYRVFLEIIEYQKKL